MSQTEIRNALQGTSFGNRVRGHRAFATRIRNERAARTAVTTVAAALQSYDDFERETFGGGVSRTVLRTPLREELGAPAEIPFHRAQYECSGFAEIHETVDTDFENFEGRQIEYLLTLDGMFMYPSKTGAFAELIDAGCAVKTKKAIYRLMKREVLKNLS